MQKKSYIIVVLILVMVVAFITNISAQPPAPPSEQGISGNANGGNAPVAGGLIILVSLAAAYGSYKVYIKRKENIEE